MRKKVFPDNQAVGEQGCCQIEKRRRDFAQADRGRRRRGGGREGGGEGGEGGGGAVSSRPCGKGGEGTGGGGAAIEGGEGGFPAAAGSSSSSSSRSRSRRSGFAEGEGFGLLGEVALVLVPGELSQVSGLKVALAQDLEVG